MAAVITFQMADWARYVRRLGPNLRVAAMAGLERAAFQSVAKLQIKTSAVGAVNYGRYKAAWKWIGIDDGVLIYNDAPYAAVLEDGRQVGARPPPSKALAQWAQRKMGLNAQDAARLGFVIARSISQKGILGRKVMTSTLPLIRQMAAAAIDASIQRALAGRRP